MKTKNILCFSVAVTLLFEVLACSAQTGAYLFTGSETNITLGPGTYIIIAYGAQGGGNGSVSGGLGAEMGAQFTFTNPTTLTLLVGGAGANGTCGGGGGGGSFIVNGATPLVIAGGGAGSGYSGAAGVNGVVQTNGVNGVGGYYPGSGGNGGGGGSGGGTGYWPNGAGGGGGGGFSGAGSGGSGGGSGGSSFLSGGTGGSGVNGGGNGGYGGGGGGGGSLDGGGGGGGGGGYSGGGGGDGNTDYIPGHQAGYSGGGGGSIIDSSATTILAGISGVASSDDSPNGEIIIFVPEPPIFTEQPTLTGGFTSNITFQAAVQGTAPLVCQWYFNNARLSDNGHYVGSMETNLTIMDFQPADIGNYILVVTNIFGSTNSAVATLTITSPPAITAQPTDITTPAASSPSFVVTVAGTGPSSYQWEFDGTNILGATNAILTLDNVQLDQSGSYAVLVTNAYGGVTSSNATLTVVPSMVTIQPPSQSAKEGTTVSFNAIVSGQGPFSYQWQFGTTNIPNATNSALALTGLQVNQSGAYTVVASNSFGVVASSNAQLTVIPWPNIQPPSQTNLIGSTVSFAATFGGATPLAYQWLFSGTNLADNGHFSGTATASLSISNIQVYDIGAYQVAINAAGNMETSSVAYLIVTNYQATTRYVNLSNSSPTYPYLDWSTAASNIQDAIDAAFDGDEILVTNGTYLVGGRVVYGSLTNRVVINKAVTVQSVNGPGMTAIQGYQVPGTTNGDSAVRCVYMTNNAALIGFTLTQGATRRAGDTSKEESGGGVWCEATNNVIISNCVISANASYNLGGGAYQGNLINCTLANNSAGTGGGASSALLANCILATNSASSGGGAYLGVLNNCIVLGNVAGSSGGGTYNSMVLNSAIAGNSASSAVSSGGGGAYGGSLVNCTITANSASSYGGGTANANQINCINYYNTGYFYSNYYSGSLTYCCTTPLPGGAGNITNEPALASISHLSLSSPCRGAGNAAATSGVDIDGEPWANPPSIGCDELYPGSANGNLTIGILTPITNFAPGFTINLLANISGPVFASKWDFGDGTVVSNRANISHSWSAVGDYPVTLTAYNDTYPTGQTGTLVVHVFLSPVHYVYLHSVNPVPPYADWSTAAKTIQDAVDAASAGDLIWVTNGYTSPPDMFFREIYQTGGRIVYGSLSNRVAITKPVTVQSVNGPAVTWISGNGWARCVYLTNGATLIGFTLTNGQAQIYAGNLTNQEGAGAWCESTNASILNCVISGNSAAGAGGGAYSGTLSNCTVINNSAWEGGGANSSTIYNCRISGDSAYRGGGVFGGIVNNSRLTNNAATSNGYGGGAFGGTLNNCTLANNTAYNGGGVCGGTSQTGLIIPTTVNNCTISNNAATYGGGAGNTDTLNPLHVTNCILNNCTLVGNPSGGASYFCQLTSCLIISNSDQIYSHEGNLNNCIIVNNGQFPVSSGQTLNNCTVVSNSTFVVSGAILNNCIVYSNKVFSFSGGAVRYCCVSGSLISGPGNFTNAPLFVNQTGGDFHLMSNSPCINSGNNAYVSVANDLDGNLRIQGGTVDMGAYEYQTPTSVISYFWLQKYGLPIDGSADYVDSDGDGMNNWQEWKAGTNPTNALSVLEMTTAAPTNNPPGLAVSWQSVSGITYFLQSSTNMAAQPAFSSIQSNIVGQAGTTSYTDTNAIGSGPYFYRVGIQ